MKLGEFVPYSLEVFFRHPKVRRLLYSANPPSQGGGGELSFKTINGESIEGSGDISTEQDLSGYSTISPRVGTTATSTSLTIDVGSVDQQNITALATDITFNAPTGTIADGKPILIRVKDNGSARNITWNAIFRGTSSLPLPTATVAGETGYYQFVYNSADTKYDFVGMTVGF